MKKSRLVLSALLAAGLLAPQSALADSSDQVAVLQDVQGDVFCTKEGGESEISAFEGMRLSAGDSIRTGSDGSAKIVYGEGTETTVSSGSQMMISELQSSSGSHQTALSLWAGNVWNKVKSLLNADDKFDVETPTAIMGVRGTLFLVGVDNKAGSAQVSVMDGTVAVAQNKMKTDTAPGPEQKVTLNQQLHVASVVAPMPDKQKLDVKNLIQTMDAKLLVQMITDVMTVAQQKNDNAKQIENNNQTTGNVDQIKQALGLASTASALSDLGQSLVQAVAASDKAGAVQAQLSQNNMTWSQLTTQMTEVSQATQQTVQQVVATAQQAGMSSTDITQIQASATAAVSPSATDTLSSSGGTSGSSTPSTGAVSPNPAPPSPSAPVQAKVWLEKTSANQLVVKASDFSAAVYGIEIHIGMDLSKLSGQPQSEGNQLFPSNMKEADYLKVNHRPDGNGELVFVQSLYNVSAGYSFSGTKTVAIIDLPIQTGAAVAPKLLSLMFVDASGNKISSIQWDSTPISMP